MAWLRGGVSWGSSWGECVAQRVRAWCGSGVECAEGFGGVGA